MTAEWGISESEAEDAEPDLDYPRPSLTILLKPNLRHCNVSQLRDWIEPSERQR